VETDLPEEPGAHTTRCWGWILPEYAKNGSQGKHDFLVAVGETTDNECHAPRQLVRTFDITTESRILGVSTWTVPEASGGFCGRGGLSARIRRMKA